ncbi:MAG: YggS family pyridoxal phosphate-dependent enzyme [Acidimicrobiales bacterium]
MTEPWREDVRARLVEVGQRIEAAGGSDVTVVAVTKAFPVGVVETALGAGAVDLGENYAQELVAKADHVLAAGLGPVRWHFIGGLQRNKVKVMGDHVHLWHSVDRGSLVDEIATRCPGARVLIQVNTTGEEAKAGCAPGITAELVDRGQHGGLDVVGLMTVGPTDPAIDPRPAFARLRQLAASCEVDQLSMGMSGDFEAAVSEGATIVRLGSILFGPRPPGRTSGVGG